MEKEFNTEKNHVRILFLSKYGAWQEGQKGVENRVKLIVTYRIYIYSLLLVWLP